MPAYDAVLFAPPAPLGRVILRHPITGATVNDVPMLIDCGADASFVPQALVATLIEASYEVEAFDGTHCFASTVRLDLLFLGRAFKGRFMLINQDYGILGRDVLNHLVLVLDGPQRNWYEKP